MTSILVNLGGVALMGAIIWWFWLSSSPEPTQDTHPTDQSEVNS